jgi:hypothetical protein
MNPADPWLKGSGKIVTYKENNVLGSIDLAVEKIIGNY